MQARSQRNDLVVAAELARVTARTEEEKERGTKAGPDFAATYPQLLSSSSA